MRCKQWFSLLLLLLVFSSIQPLFAADAATADKFYLKVKDGCAVYLCPEKPAAGQALVVAFRVLLADKVKSKPCSLTMTFFKHQFQLEAIDGGWRGIAAVPLGTKPGTYSLKINLSEGKSLVLPVSVLGHDYGEQRLTVKAEMATPMRPENLAKIKRDRRDLKVAYGSSKPSLLFADELRQPMTSRLTSPFGTRRLLNGKPKSPHGGVDFKAKIGLPVAAAAAGRVALAEELYYSGRIVIIDHGLSIFSLYMHLSEIDCQVGDLVAAGQIIGKSGRSGRVTGPHLHWGIKIAGVFVDPLRFMEESKYLLKIPWESENGKSEL